MSELTLKAIEQVLDTKLKPITTSVQLIKTGMASLASSEELRTLSKKIDAVQKTLDVHTAALEKLLTTKKTKDEEKAVSVERFDRLEHWAQQVGEKLGISLEL